MLNISDSNVTYKISFLHLGFRPFFIGAAIFAVVATLIWMGIYVFQWQIASKHLVPVVWHGHEMIFGYAMAVVAGFLLTAIKNWTDQQTLNGVPLLLLFLCWATARVLFFVDVPLFAVAVFDLGFTSALVISCALPILKVKQWKNVPIVLKIGLLFLSNLAFYYGAINSDNQWSSAGLYSGLYIILALIFTMGRRVIPFFIENGVDYKIELVNKRWVDISSLLLFLVFWIAEIIQPDSVVVMVLSVLLFVVHGIRLTNWYTHGIWQKPLLWVLYLAYASIVAGFLLKASVYFTGISPFIALHAFTYGGVGIMTIGMMARVSLGHTGRNVFEPPKIVFLIFAIIVAGLLFRVVMPLLIPSMYVTWIAVSQGAWILSFLLFLSVYFMMLVKPRIDGRYG